MPNDKSNTYPDAVIEIADAEPAGLVAAITLARCQVVVHEAHQEVGHRFGGDFQGLENWTTKADVLHVLAGQGLTTDFKAVPSAIVVWIRWPGRGFSPLTQAPAGSMNQTPSREPAQRCLL